LLAIAFREPGVAGEVPTVSLLAYQPTEKQKDSFYVKHPLYDVAALRLRFPPDVAQQAKLPSELSQRKLLKDRVEVRPGDEVYFLGYPEVFPGTDGAMPILRSGRVASYIAGNGGENGRFLINADVYPGDSGGPVFVVRHGRAHLAGVITQRVGSTKQSFSHLAIAVNAAAIRETLELLIQSERQ
jgi:hypothetical protein